MTLNFDKSAARVKAASRYIPGGVNSNFRAGISPTPLVIEKGEGAYLTDADGNQLVDYYLGMGAILLGHNPKVVVDAIKEQLERGIIYAAQCEIEYKAAELFCKMIPCAERVRFNSSGSEAVQAVFRLARAATGRPTIVKFEGHYHGWFDNITWSTAPGPAEYGSEDEPPHVSGTPGMAPHSDAGLDVVVWNDLERLRKRLMRRDVAAVIMEPAMCNTSAIHPAPGYLEGVRNLCDETGTILIFDEVITGFRVAPGGVQSVVKVTPDMAVFGKAIANGMPVAAFAGKAEIMDLVVTKKVLHGGTYNAHPLSMAALVATLETIADGTVHAGIAKTGTRLMSGFERIMRERQVAGLVQGFPGIFHVALGRREPIRNYRDATTADKALYVKLTTAMMGHGVRALERGAWFVSAAHDDAAVDVTLAAFDTALGAISN